MAHHHCPFITPTNSYGPSIAGWGSGNDADFGLGAELLYWGSEATILFYIHCYMPGFFNLYIHTDF